MKLLLMSSTPQYHAPPSPPQALRTTPGLTVAAVAHCGSGGPPTPRPQTWVEDSQWHRAGPGASYLYNRKPLQELVKDDIPYGQAHVHAFKGSSIS